MDNVEKILLCGRKQWWLFLLEELPGLLKRDPRVVQYIEQEIRNSDLLGFACLEDICSQNYHTTGDLISGMIQMFETYDWSEEDNEKMAEYFLSLREEITRLQANGEDHSHAAYMRSLPFRSGTTVKPEDFLCEEEFSPAAYRYLSCHQIRTKQELMNMNFMTCMVKSAADEIRGYQNALIRAGRSEKGEKNG